MLIKQFAAKYHLSQDTLRFYEKEGMLNPQRLENGYRFYDETCERAVKFIQVMKNIGFSLQEIKQLLTLDGLPMSEECNQASSALFANKINGVERQLVFFSMALEILKMAQGLVENGKYESNKGEIDAAIEEIYRKLGDDFA
ncbi:MerR family transcriptional regulator [Metasolibacillus meyeri]|uniref:MerR family transcriptional regulator n=1 Tax=Metasolibacillus meyeri TaxID=1071052 RepID=UPI000D3030AA|nr:MerR family transcriptional regulator [Metasolibacillus meyeri]